MDRALVGCTLKSVMTASLSPTIFPRAAHYLSQLEDGLLSFPDCLVLTHLFKRIRTDFPNLIRGRAVPATIEALFAGRLGELWIPEACGNVAYLMVRDAECASDEQFFAWNAQNIKQVIGSPFYRGLMGLMSTSFLVKSTAKRWFSFHRGTEMSDAKITTHDGRCEARISLVAPEKLFTPLLLRQHCSTFLALLTMAGAKDPASSIEHMASGVTEYVASWGE